MKGLGWRGGAGCLRFNGSLRMYLSKLSLLPDEGRQKRDTYVFEDLMGH